MCNVHYTTSWYISEEQWQKQGHLCPRNKFRPLVTARSVLQKSLRALSRWWFIFNQDLLSLSCSSYPQSYEPSALHEYSQSLNTPPDEVMMLDLCYSKETELEKLSNLLKVIWKFRFVFQACSSFLQSLTFRKSN